MNSWRAGCSESCASGSEGGPGRRIGREADTAPPVRPYTYVPTWEGYLSLPAVIDCFSRRCVGWSMRDDLRSELVLDALGMAVTRRPQAGVIHHSDRGSQYTSLDFGKTLEAGGRDPVDRSPRRRLRQHGRRVVLRDARVRADRSAHLQAPRSGEARGLRVHRELLQPEAPALGARLRLPRPLRAPIIQDGEGSRGAACRPRCQPKRGSSMLHIHRVGGTTSHAFTPTLGRAGRVSPAASPGWGW